MNFRFRAACPDPLPAAGRAGIHPLLLLCLFGFLLSGCSNAPPNPYAAPGQGHPAPQGFSYAGRFMGGKEGKTYRSYRDPVPRERSDGLEGHPQYWNMIDLFTFSWYRSRENVFYGLYTSNFYPGLFLGYDLDFISINGFLSGSFPGKKLFPGLQILADHRYLHASYSFYRQNLGSSMGLPAWGEEGPYRVVWAERYNLACRLFGAGSWHGIGLGIGVFLDRSYWKNVYASGLEIVIFH